jgi:hypothetical protein
MFIVFALWLIQTARWGAMTAHSAFTGFLGPDWMEVERFLPAFMRTRLYRLRWL